MTTPPAARTVFGFPDFRSLFAADAISQFGTQLTMLALPVLAVTVLAADERQMGILAALETLAFLVLGLPAGAWVDRWRKRRVLMAGDLVRALALGSIPLAWAVDALTLTQVFVVATVVGTATVFFDIAYQSVLPDLVPDRLIAEGNARLQAAQSVSQVGGPAAAGGLIRLIGAPLTIAVDAVSFLASAIFVSRIRHRPAPADLAARRPLRAEIVEGLGFVLRHPLLSRIVACTSLSNLSSSLVAGLFVLYALRDLRIDEATLGVVFAAGSVGALLAALACDRVIAAVGEGRVIPLSAVAMVPFTALPALAPPGWWGAGVLVVSTFAWSFGVVIYNVAQVSFRQRLCPRPLLGRMNASIRFLVTGVQPIGAVLGGLLGAWLGIRPVIWISSVGGLLACLPVLASPLLRLRELPADRDPAEPAEVPGPEDKSAPDNQTSPVDEPRPDR